MVCLCFKRDTTHWGKSAVYYCTHVLMVQWALFAETVCWVCSFLAFLYRHIQVFQLHLSFHSLSYKGHIPIFEGDNGILTNPHFVGPLWVTYGWIRDPLNHRRRRIWTSLLFCLFWGQCWTVWLNQALMKQLGVEILSETLWVNFLCHAHLVATNHVTSRLFCLVLFNKLEESVYN